MQRTCCHTPKRGVFYFVLVGLMISFAQAQEDSPAPAPNPTPAVEQELTPEEQGIPTPPPPPVAAPEPAPAKESVSPAPPPVKKNMRLKTVRDEEHTKPVYFESLENLMPNMDLEYDLTQKNGNSLKIGDVVIDEQSFFFALVPISRFHAKMAEIIDSSEGSKLALVLRWPEPLLAAGRLEVISRTGSVLWKYEISEKDRAGWTKKLSQWKIALEEKGVKTEKLSKSSAFYTQYGIENIFAQGFKIPGESFRFCLTQAFGRSQSRLCSQRYVIRGGKNVQMSKVKTVSQPRVVLQSAAAPLEQKIPVAMNMPTNFFAELANGISYEFIALPNKLNLTDLSDTKDPNKLRIVAFGTRPTSESKLVNPDDYSSLTKAIGFEATIGDLRKFWETTIYADDPKIYLPGQGGGVFAQRFELAKVPQANARPYLETRTPTGTYIDGVKLYGKRSPDVKLSSIENSLEMDENDPQFFTWHFKALQRGEMNRAYLSMEFQGKQYKAYHELYKGYPRELSARLSAMIGEGGTNIFMGEVAYNQWFEDIFGWTNFWLARQRWGVAAKMFQSFTQLKINDKGATAGISVTNVDLKYRFVPGLWNRDETLGAMLDYQDITFGEIKAPMIGAGAFWARSMPKIFDDFFNLAPFMRYPKWVDMEFIYYPMSLASDVTLQTNFATNFHGKVMWTKNLFGEAGFGVKRYAIVDVKAQQKALLTTFYGTFGLGLSF